MGLTTAFVILHHVTKLNSVNPCLMGFPMKHNGNTSGPTTMSSQSLIGNVSKGNMVVLEGLVEPWYCACATSYVGNLCQYSPGWTCNNNGQPNSSGECSCFMQNEASDKASDKNVRFSFDWLGPKCQYFREGPKRIFSLIFFAFLLSIMPCVISQYLNLGHFFKPLQNFFVF
eukprot:m.289488 g.289488  ORF g.289488 m.289488 type:complete len:172 (+) comp16373_c0_seq51:320-835(+)